MEPSGTMTEMVENEEEIEMWKIRKVRAVFLAPHPRASVKKSTAIARAI